MRDGHPRNPPRRQGEKVKVFDERGWVVGRGIRAGKDPSGRDVVEVRGRLLSRARSFEDDAGRLVDAVFVPLDEGPTGRHTVDDEARAHASREGRPQPSRGMRVGGALLLLMGGAGVLIGLGGLTFVPSLFDQDPDVRAQAGALLMASVLYLAVGSLLLIVGVKVMRPKPAKGQAPPSSRPHPHLASGQRATALMLLLAGGARCLAASLATWEFAQEWNRPLSAYSTAGQLGAAVVFISATTILGVLQIYSGARMHRGRARGTGLAVLATVLGIPSLLALGLAIPTALTLWLLLVVLADLRIILNLRWGAEGV